MIRKKSYAEPELDINEILRYCGCANQDKQIEELINEAVNEALPLLSYRVCYDIFDINITESKCNLGFTATISDDLAKNLKGCDKIILFGATVGISVDRLIAKYSKISPAKALIMQSLGAERIEALCDMFFSEMSKDFNLRPRFSPGYGDLSLKIQNDIFAVLDCPKQIGLTLNESLLMSPTKSVTAIIGIKTQEKQK